jgi:four helix bundle protein
MRRAVVSVLSNIAEGFERGSNAEFIHYLYISKGSCGEVRAQLTVALDLDYIPQPIYEELTISCRRVSGMLANLITHLKNSGFRGSKYTKLPKTASPLNP